MTSLRTLTLAALAVAFAAACGKKDAASAGGPPPDRVAIEVTQAGFRPAEVRVGANHQTTLVFTRRTDATCAKEVAIPMPDGTTIRRELPLDQPVEIAAVFPKAGQVRYACGMDMVSAVIQVE